MRNIEILNETIQNIENGQYTKEKQKIKLKLHQNQYIEAIYLSEKEITSFYNQDAFSTIKPPAFGNCYISITNCDSFESALKMQQSIDKQKEKVLVLNFANPVNPGGGVRYGAVAQEEDLCRKSTLLFSLESNEASEFYTFHQKLGSNLSSHSMILSPNVEVIRDSKNQFLSDTQVVSVLTCAAPINIGNTNADISKQAYEKLLYERIKYMLFIAAKYGYHYLVLGAWGCGAFNNDASLVAKLFRKALNEKAISGIYVKNYFRKIDFAVLCKSSDMYNFNCFYSQLADENNQPKKVIAHHKNIKEIKREDIKNNIKKFSTVFLIGIGTGVIISHIVNKIHNIV